ncbi:MAG: bacillithiol biosynthesis deacetylase BshB1 [Longimicrobiales bacterium]|jgi:bacillithiol biosynthesis deacetylase BshB1
MAELDSPLDLLAIMAHPDDAELLCGGTLVKSASRGKRVGVIDLTAGEMGSSGSVETRAREAANAGVQLGLAIRACAELPDSNLQNDHESRLVVAALIRAFRPRVVITHWTVGRHRDHRIASELVRDACFLSALRKLDIPGEPFRPHKLVYATAFREDAEPPDFVVDITEQMDRKLDAISAYASQFDGAVQAGEVFPGGGRDLIAQIRAKTAHYGSLIRVRYGEPYRLDETMEVDELSELGVSTF